VKDIAVEGIRYSLPKLNLGLEKVQPEIVVLKILPHIKEEGGGVQYYAQEDGTYSVKVSYEGAFNKKGEQQVLHTYIPEGSPLVEGPLFQGTTGYIKVDRLQLEIIKEVFSEGDYLALIGWSSDVFLGVNKAGFPSLSMILFNKEGLQLGRVPGNKTITPFPKPDGRTIAARQHKEGVAGLVKKDDIPF
jgi:hypothetical protein